MSRNIHCGTEIDALRNRARTALLSLALTDTKRPDQFDFWQGYAKALRDLGRCNGRKLAAKDAALQGYQLPSFLQAAADCLGQDIYLLPRAEVVNRLAQAGIKLAADDVADFKVVPDHEFEDAAATTADLNSKHAATSVDCDDGALHGATPCVLNAATVALQGGAE